MCRILSFCWQISTLNVLTLAGYIATNYSFFPGSRARAPSLRWITMHRLSVRLWIRPDVGSVCHPGRRSRRWWTDRRCCALYTILVRDPASSISVLTLLPMRFGYMSCTNKLEHVHYRNIKNRNGFAALFICLFVHQLSSNVSPVGSKDAGEARTAREQKHICTVRAECTVGAAGCRQHSDCRHPDQVWKVNFSRQPVKHNKHTHSHTLPMWRTDAIKTKQTHMI